MNYVLGALTGLTLLAVCVGESDAQEQKKREQQRFDPAFFERLDTNKDGTVTMDEIPADRLEIAKRVFDRLDNDKDGNLTRAEFDAGMTRARAKRQPAERRRPDSTPQPTSTPPQPEPRQPRRPDENARPGQPPTAGRPGSPGTPGAPMPPFGFGGPDLFRALDSDRDGKLSKTEIAKAIDTLMKYDKNGDDLLTPDELAEGVRESLPPGATRPPGFPPGDAPGRFLDVMIQRSDKNGDGKLNKDEVPDMMRDRFDEIDRNKDGLLDKDELGVVGDRFRRMREQGGAQPGLPGRPGSPPGAAAGGLNDGNRDRVAGYLREHDKDIDGRVSPKEFGEDRADEFKKMDSNSDGYLSPDELARGFRTAF